MILAPLVDEALDLPAERRAEWIAQQTLLTRPLQETLRAMLAAHDAPESGSFFDPNAMSALRETALRSQSPQATRYREGDRVGPYTVIRLIGKGGMGEVWVAKRTDGAFQREVALKVCNIDHSPQKIRERLARERDVLASLEHPNIARFYDAGMDDREQPFIAMEHIDGITLKDYVVNNHADVQTVCRLVAQVLTAIQYAHQQLVVHRDLKPNNILVRADEAVSLLDFGIAKILDETTQTSEVTQLTRDAGYALTPAYAAPEQLRGATISTATDVFACGVILYELLTGDRPFRAAESNLLELTRAQSEPFAPIKSIRNRTASRDLNAIVSCALRSEPSERYESAAAFAEDLQRFLRNEPVRAVSGARWYHFTKFVKRHRAGVLFAGASLLALLAFAVILYLQYQHSEMLRIRAQNVERVMSGVFAGMNPTSSDAQLAHPKELLDRSVDALGATALDPAIAIRLASVYRRLDLPDSALSIIERSLKRPREAGSRLDDGDAKLFATIAQIQTERKQFALAETALAHAQAAFPGLLFADQEARWLLEFATGQVKFARGNMREAEASFLASRVRAVKIGRNELDALTTTIDHQAELARAEGQWQKVRAHIDEANRYAAIFGEVDPSLKIERMLAEARTLLAMGESLGAVDVMQKHFEDAKRRYPFAHIKRVESGLWLVHAYQRTEQHDQAERAYQAMLPSTPHVLSDSTSARYFLTPSGGYGLRPLDSKKWMGGFFLHSVIRSRPDLQLLFERVEWLRSKRSGNDSTGIAVWPTPDFKPTDSGAGAVAGNKRKLVLSGAQRAGLAIGYANYLIVNNRISDAQVELRIAEEILGNDNAANKLDLAEVRLTAGMLKLRQKDFPAAAQQFTKVREVYQAVLPATSPRIAVASFYAALSELQPETTALNTISSIRQRLSDLEASRLPPALQKRLSDWVQANSDAPNWATLPVVSP